MQVLKKGDYKLKDWSLEVECTGIGYDNKRKPCHSIIKLEDGDIVRFHRQKNLGFGTYKYWLSYGFICCNCRCFTEVSGDLIPREIRDYSPNIAQKYQKEYSDLSEEEKKLSEYL